MSDSILQGTMAELTWPELERLGTEGRIVLLSVEVLEEHGPHLPLATDICLGYTVTRRTKHHLAKRSIASILAPPVYWSMNNTTAAFPGSFTLRKETCKALLYDILASLQRWRFERVFVIALHGEPAHRSTLLVGIAEARLDCGTRAMAIVPDRYARHAELTGQEPHVLIQRTGVEGPVFTSHQDYHAGVLETSFMQRYYPQQVDVDKARQLAPTRHRRSTKQPERCAWRAVRGQAQRRSLLAQVALSW